MEKQFHFPKKFPNFERFENSDALLPLETHSRKNLPRLVILKKFKDLFKKTVLFFKNNPNFERFESSYATLPFETHSRKNVALIQQYLKISRT